MSANLYPLQFHPILKERIWGGEKLKTILNKPITSKITGESWEISTVENDVSTISNGIYQGKTLTDLINSDPIAILGTKVFEEFGAQFPLLFKYLDAREDLSIQVHPNDFLAKERHNSFGKTEMWYVMQAEENANIIVGFRENSNPKKYLEHLKDNTLVSILDTIKVQKGDVYFLETGTVHAIGAGLLIAEIQQTSDITYRLYDFDRKDASGKTRELHIDLALDAINYNKIETKKNYSKKSNVSNTVVDCKYFTTNWIHLDASMTLKNDACSFKVLMCTEGFYDLIVDNKTYSYKTGDTILIPAAINAMVLKGNATILEIFIS